MADNVMTMNLADNGDGILQHHGQQGWIRRPKELLPRRDFLFAGTALKFKPGYLEDVGFNDQRH